jgi:hypothetical protein
VSRLIRSLVILALIAGAPGCAHSTPGASVERAVMRRSDVISREELDRQHWSNAYDAVQALRPAWLNDRGPDTAMGTPVELQVHVNGMRVGGISVLRETGVTDLTYLEYFDPVSATARWGLGYGHGAINLSTRPKEPH